MMSQSSVTVADIAIVGLGEIGGPFLEEILRLRDRGIRVVCAAQNSDTAGKRRAQEAGIPLKTIDEMIAIGGAIDVIFDLTGNPEVRKEMRTKMQATGNRHTIIAPETMARMLWTVISDEQLGAGHTDRGY
jgi:ketol-acid reductoisomerase